MKAAANLKPHNLSRCYRKVSLVFQEFKNS